MQLTDIQFTPSQQAEIAAANPDIVNAWLNVLNHTPGIKSPAGWLLAAIRTGRTPGDQTDAQERQAIQRAENLVRNLGPLLLNEDELLAEVFGPPELTADLATLERIERELTPTQRAYLGGVLTAQLDDTRRQGRREVPGTRGPLHHYDTPANRARILALWQAVSQTAPQGLR